MHRSAAFSLIKPQGVRTCSCLVSGRLQPPDRSPRELTQPAVLPHGVFLGYSVSDWRQNAAAGIATLCEVPAWHTARRLRGVETAPGLR